jgi:hypothetical protein
MIVRGGARAALAFVALATLLQTGCGPGTDGGVVSVSAPSAIASGADDRNPELTPGEKCTRDDPDFQEYRYAERIPYCRRHVTHGDKVAIGRTYGIDEADFHLYQARRQSP